MKRQYTYDEPVVVGEQVMYTVESILDQKTIKDKKYFLVKWVGWPEETATWEPYQNIKHLEEIVKQFKKREKQLGEKQPSASYGRSMKDVANPFETTQKNGHFIYGDKPKQILKVQVTKLGKKKHINLQIEWMPRSDGTIPCISKMPIATACEYEPLFLFDFLQKHVEFEYQNSLQDQLNEQKPEQTQKPKKIRKKLNNSELQQTDRIIKKVSKNNSQKKLADSKFQLQGQNSGNQPHQIEQISVNSNSNSQ